MLSNHPFASSRPVVLLLYQARWAQEFMAIAQRIRAVAGHASLRIDHIGSTAVPALAAKDVIDVQLTVAATEDTAPLMAQLAQAGFQLRALVAYDAFHGLPPQSPELRKSYLREPPGERRTHLHVREAGRFNARYALLFRDYLRANAHARQEYELLKYRAAELFPTSIEGYLYLKEPAFHLIYHAADLWAQQVGWAPASSLTIKLRKLLTKLGSS